MRQGIRFLWCYSCVVTSGPLYEGLVCESFTRFWYAPGGDKNVSLGPSAV